MPQEVIDELEKAWALYQNLGIEGKGEGGKLKYMFRRFRVKLEEEYKELPNAVKEAKEVALVRHKWFVMRSDGTLDYGTDEKVKE